METFSALLAICAGNSPVPGEFPTQSPVTRSSDVFFYLRLNKRLSKQSWVWWLKMLSRPLWRHRNGINCNASTDKELPLLQNVGWNSVPIHSLGMDKWFHHTFHRACNYLPMLGLKYIYTLVRGAQTLQILNLGIKIRFMFVLLHYNLRRCMCKHSHANTV